MCKTPTSQVAYNRNQNSVVSIAQVHVAIHVALAHAYSAPTKETGTFIQLLVYPYIFKINWLIGMYYYSI